MQFRKVNNPIGDLARDAYTDFNGSSCWSGRGSWNGSLADLTEILDEHGSAEARNTMKEAERQYRKYQAETVA
jgi:hypothetical protein